jgi:5-methylcytosine-specific restriction endonuclease McrA
MNSVKNETEVCPYCFEPIINGNIDHIYPLTLGGLNISQNLVLCCDKCNNKKAGMTLNEFIYEYNLDWKKIKKRLKELNKRF